MMVSGDPSRVAVAFTRYCKRSQTSAYLDMVLSLNALFHAQPSDSSAEVKTDEDGDA